MSSNSILEPLEAGLTPRILDDVHARRRHVCINECHPLSNLKPRWCNCRAILTIRQTFEKHPCRPFVTHLNLEWLVEADVDRLAKTCAATRNMDNFNAHFLDRLHNRRHHVTAVAVEDEERNHVLRSCLDIRLQHFLVFWFIVK